MANQDQQIVYQIPFTQIPNWVFGKLEPNELAVLCVLLSFGTTEAFPSQSTIASMAMISRKTVQRALTGLVDKQIIRWTQRQKNDGSLSSNLYEVLVWDLASKDPCVRLTQPLGQIDPTPGSERPNPCVRLTQPLGQIDAVTRLIEQDLLNKKEEEPPKKAKRKVLKKDQLIQEWIEKAPIEFSGYLEPVKAWLEQRWDSHPSNGRKDPWGLHQRSAKALRYAISKNAADEFLSQAAERGWLSLGFANWEQKIDQLVKPVGHSRKPDPLDTPRSAKKELCMQWLASDAAPGSDPIPLSIADLTAEHALGGQFFFANETPATEQAKKIITDFRKLSTSTGIDQ